jgi:hypothetical protein
VYMLLLCTVLLLLPAAPVSRAAPGDPCPPDSVVKCVEETIGIDLTVHELPPEHTISFGSTLVISWWEDDCEWRQVVIVAINNLPELLDHMTPLAANEWNAMGELSREEFQDLLARRILTVLWAGEPFMETCKKEGLPPCELPWGEIVIDPIRWPDAPITLYSSLEPITNPEFCFSYDLEREPIIGPVPDVMVPFFFMRKKDIPLMRQLLREQM